MKHPSLLVIIVTYNAMKWTEKCFSSLYESTIVPDVFVVDNGSTDGTQAYVAQHFPQVIFKQSPTNCGFGRANNVGLQYAVEHDYDYVYLLNQDAWVAPKTFEELIAISERHSEYGIISPLQCNNPKRVDRSLLDYIPKSLVSDLLVGNEVGDIYEISRPMAAHWLITRKALLAIGGFSPAFKHYGEDDNYMNRATFLGFKIGLAPKLTVIHDRGERPTLSKEKLFYFKEVMAITMICDPNLPARLVFTYPFSYFLAARRLFFFRAIRRTILFLFEVPYFIKCRNQSKSFAFLN